MTETEMEKNGDSDSEVRNLISDDMQNESSSEDEQENIKWIHRIGCVINKDTLR